MRAQKKLLKTRAPFSLMDESTEEGLSLLFQILDSLQYSPYFVELSLILREELRTLYPQGKTEITRTNLDNGLQFYVDLGDIFAAEFHLGHFNEADFLNALTFSLPEGCKAIDVGANFGLYALHLAHVGGSKSKVVAFKPVPSAANLCAKNIHHNGYGDRIQLIKSAVGEQLKSSKFYIAKDSAFSGLHNTKRSTVLKKISVNVTALDNDKMSKELESIDFLKIDVEGHEGNVLAGASGIISSSPNILIALEFSCKNLTKNGKKKVLEQVEDLMNQGFKSQMLDASRLIDFSQIEEISSDFSGTIILARETCNWYNKFCQSFDEIQKIKSAKFHTKTFEILLQRHKSSREQLANIEGIASEFNLDAIKGSLAKQIKTHFRKMKKHNLKLDQQCAALEKKNAHLEIKNQSLKQKLKQKIENINQTKEGLVHSNRGIENFRKSLENSQRKLDERIEASKQAAIEHSKTKKTLEGMVAKKDKQVKATQERLEQSHKGLEELKDRLENSQRKLDERIEVSKQAAIEHSKTKKTLEGMVAKKDKQVKATQERLEQSNERLNVFKERLKVTQKKLDARKTAADKVITKHLKTKKTLEEMLVKKTENLRLTRERLENFEQSSNAK